MARSSADPDDLDRFMTDAHAAREDLFLQARTIPVIGRLDDTAVAQPWAGHEVLALKPWLTGPWNEKINDRWIDGIIRAKRVVYLGSTPDMTDIFTPRIGESVFRVEVRDLLQAGYRHVGDYLVPPGG